MSADEITFPTTFLTKSGRKLVVSPVEIDGGHYDVEYLDDLGKVERYRPSLPSQTVRDLARVEGWERV